MFNQYQTFSTQGGYGGQKSLGGAGLANSIANNVQQQLNSVSSLQKVKVYDQATGTYKEVQNTSGQWNPSGYN